MRYGEPAVVFGKPVRRRRGPRHCERGVPGPRPARDSHWPPPGGREGGPGASDPPPLSTPLFYNLTITGLSIAVAFFIGTIELVGVLHDRLDLTDGVTGWIAGLDLDNVGYVIVGLFVVVWAAAVTYWRLARVEERWTVPANAGTEGP